LTDFDEILNADAYWPSEPYRPEKNQNLKNLDGRRPSFRKRKSSFTLLTFLKM